MTAKNVPAKSDRREELRWIDVDHLDVLRRNPQFLTPAQMRSLKASIERDGFVVPILVRPHGEMRFEIVSGNHRVMAAREIGRKQVPCVIVEGMTERDAMRLAVNLNLIHGDPPAALLAPFLAEMDAELLRDIHLDGELRHQVLDFDRDLATTLADLERDMPGVSNQSMTSEIGRCVCPTCGKSHIRSSDERRNTAE